MLFSCFLFRFLGFYCLGETFGTFISIKMNFDEMFVHFVSARINFVETFVYFVSERTVFYETFIDFVSMSMPLPFFSDTSFDRFY